MDDGVDADLHTCRLQLVDVTATCEGAVDDTPEARSMLPIFLPSRTDEPQPSQPKRLAVKSLRRWRRQLGEHLHSGEAQSVKVQHLFVLALQVWQLLDLLFAVPEQEPCGGGPVATIPASTSIHPSTGAPFTCIH